MALSFEFTDARHGRMAVLSNDTYVSRSLLHYGEWTELELSVIAQILKPGDVVADIGANIGSHTIPFAKAVGADGCVYAFEPQPKVFELLAANIVMNELDQVRLFNAALGRDAGSIAIAEVDRRQALNHGALSLETLAKSATDHPQRVRTIPVIRFDDVFQHDRLGFLKIDVEGMEVDVLLGARKTITKYRPLIYVENDRVEKSDGLMRTLAELRYKCYWHITPCFNPDNFRKQAQNIFPGVFSFNMLCVPEELQANINGLKLINPGDTHPLQRPKT